MYEGIGEIAYPTLISVFLEPPPIRPPCRCHIRIAPYPHHFAFVHFTSFRSLISINRPNPISVTHLLAARAIDIFESEESAARNMLGDVTFRSRNEN